MLLTPFHVKATGRVFQARPGTRSSGTAGTVQAWFGNNTTDNRRGWLGGFGDTSLDWSEQASQFSPNQY